MTSLLKNKTNLTVSIALAAATFFATQEAQALAISISDGTTTITSADADGDGFELINSAVGLWNINVVSGFSDPDIDPSGIYALHLNSLNVGGGSAGGTLTIMITDTDLNKTNAAFNAALGGVTGGTMSFATYLSTSNTAFGLDTLLSSGGTYSGGAYSSTDSGYIGDLAGLYSMTMVVNVTHDSRRDISSFDYQVSVPEPISLALFGAGLLGMGFIGRGKRQG